MAFSISNLLQLQQSEVTTVIRWLLRGILVVFLVWLVRRKPEQVEDEDDDDSLQNGDTRRPSAKSRAASARSMARMQPKQRDPYAPGTRQRRTGGNWGDSGGGGGGYGSGPSNFDAVISKLSKPKDMWEVRKSGEGPPQILRQKQQSDSPAGLSPPGASGPPGLGSGACGGSAASAAPGAAAAALAAVVGAASGSGSGSVARTSTSGGRVPLEVKPPSQARSKENTLQRHERPVTFITWNHDGNLLFTCGKDKIVCVWSVPEGDCLGTYAGHNGAVWSCSVTSDSRWLVTSGADRLVIVWEARASRELARVELPGVVRCCEWAGRGGSPSSETERFATCHNRFGSKPPTVTVWRFDGTAIEKLLDITNLPTPASQVRWGRDDEEVASAHENGQIVFWRSDTGVEVHRLQAHEESVSKFEFSQDRELIATASPDKSVRIWDLAKGGEYKKLYHMDTDRPLNDVAFGPVTRKAAVGPPSERPTRCCVIAAGGQDVRDVTTSSSSTEQFGTLLFKLGSGESHPCELEADGITKGHFGPVHTLSFARDGSAIASGSEDGCVRLHLFDNKEKENIGKPAAPAST